MQDNIGTNIVSKLSAIEHQLRQIAIALDKLVQSKGL